MSQNEELPGLIKLLSHRILFFLHLFAYGAVSLLLILIWAVSLPTLPTTYFIPFFPIFGWGFGIGFHALVYLMYNDKIKYLSELRKQSGFKILFIFHAWFYGSINLFLLILNLTTIPSEPLFLWPLGGWGVAFGFHAFGFFTWDKALVVQISRLREKHPDYSEQRLKEFASSKLLGIEVLMMHVTYFAIVNVIVYTTQIWIPEVVPPTLIEVIEATIAWGVFVAIHLLAYYLLNYVENMKIEMKFLLLHGLGYVGLAVVGLIEQLTTSGGAFWWYIPVVLWAIVFGIHTVVSLKWDAILPPALEKVKRRSPEGLEEYKYQRITYWVLLCRFSFIAHIFVYILGIIILNVQFVSVLGLDINIWIIVVLGWLIGLLVHGALYYVVFKNVSGFLMWTAILHLAAYIGGIPLLITINMIYYPEFLSSAIALGGWAIGLGAHLLIAFLTKPK
ncbi:MAG: 2TM domain-containing protein [Candidatus Lokiarchaeota archaeon]|nr:2TM domain-containing protein [Candidatus Lokiarchaeota archaeon]